MGQIESLTLPFKKLRIFLNENCPFCASLVVYLLTRSRSITRGGLIEGYLSRTKSFPAGPIKSGLYLISLELPRHNLGAPHGIILTLYWQIFYGIGTLDTSLTYLALQKKYGCFYFCQVQGNALFISPQFLYSVFAKLENNEIQ